MATPFTAVAAPGKVAVPVPEALPKVTCVALSVVTVLPPASWIVAVTVREPPPAVEPEVARVTWLAAPTVMLNALETPFASAAVLVVVSV